MADGALPGFRDFYPDELAKRAHIFGAWREVARRYAFVEYDGPPLEPLDLYTKKSGDEIAGQLYNFTDKGGREVALRPEMTPTFARMVAARANALRKPVRWFSVPQLFRYERAQRGRLREHFQLNVDIVGEPSELADAELLCVAIDIMRELRLGAADVRARVSDRRLATALVLAHDLPEEAVPVVFAAFDKIDRSGPQADWQSKLKAQLDSITPKGSGDASASLYALAKTRDAVHNYVSHALVAPHWARLQRYFGHLEALGVRDWVDLDLSIVRGLAYYTGIVFELFDARGELRAICGGGRYDTLLAALGDVDLPALGFGMGDVVLGELLTDRKLWPADDAKRADLFVVGGPGAGTHGVDHALGLARVMRGAGFSVDYLLNAERYLTQAFRNQVDSAKKSGARAAIYFDSDADVAVWGLDGKLNDAPKQTFAAAPLLAGDGHAVAALKDWYGQAFLSRNAT